MRQLWRFAPRPLTWAFTDVSGSCNIRLELLGEVTDANSNEIAVQQVSNQTRGPLVVSDLVTPDETGNARLFIASYNNSVDMTDTDIQIDATDTLGFEVFKASNTNPVEVLLPALSVVEG